MAERKLKECKQRGCYELTRNKEGYCDKHLDAYLQQQNAQKKAWKVATGYKAPKTNSKTEKFYSSVQWQSLRKAKLASVDYLCEECLKHGVTKTATQVHHKVTILKDWDKRFDINNLEALCNICHREVRHHGKSWEKAHEDR